MSHHLICPASWSGGHGNITFRYSSPDGSGHVAEPSYTYFIHDVKLGAGGECFSIHRSEPREPGQVCVFAMSAPTNEAVADCNTPNVPGSHNYQYEIRCGVAEICDDGIDNTGDGLIDCASPACHPSINNNFVPQICDPGTNATNPNNQTTADCLADPARCHNPNTNLNYYCSYGIDDNPIADPSPLGRCCPAGQYAEFDSIVNEWRCVSFEECFLTDAFGVPDPVLQCKFDFDSNALNAHPVDSWWASTFYGDSLDYCHSPLPMLHDDEAGTPTRSSACCEIERFGNRAHYFVGDNVKIYG